MKPASLTGGEALPAATGRLEETLFEVREGHPGVPVLTHQLDAALSVQPLSQDKEGAAPIDAELLPVGGSEEIDVAAGASEDLGGDRV